jgi:N6-L-threonylcarbamoyladenine synthase
LLGLQRGVVSCGFQRHAKNLLTLAIETSCDDTSVALLEHGGDKSSTKLHDPRTILHFHEKITSNNSKYGGIHPLVALESHQENLAILLEKAIAALPATKVSKDNHGAELRKPDFISVTQGPGMRSSLQTGLDTAKGLAVAWRIPLVGVHHMQAHALTPRFLYALQNQRNADNASKLSPGFPFLSVLVSGGHTLIIYSASLTDHRILASTSDIAIGDCLDKIARTVLPSEILVTSGTTMYGAMLEKFAFPQGESNYVFHPPKSLIDELRKKETQWGWALKPPLSQSPMSVKARSLELSFSGLVTACERISNSRIDQTGRLTSTARPSADFSMEERKDLAREAMRVAFEHLVSRTILALEHVKLQSEGKGDPVGTIVVSGGVASNQFLRHV